MGARLWDMKLLKIKMFNGSVRLKAAEEHFQQIEHPSLTASLKRHHGIAA